MTGTRAARSRGRREIVADLAHFVRRVSDGSKVELTEIDAQQNSDARVDALLLQLIHAIRSEIEVAYGNDHEARLQDLLILATEVFVLEQEWRRHWTRNATQRREVLEASLGRLRAYRTESELFEQICVESSRACGTDRAFFACIDRGTWIPSQSFGSRNLRGTAIEQWNGLALQVDALPLESELAGKLRTVVVDTVERKEQAPRPVQKVMQNHSFVITAIPSVGTVTGALYVPFSPRASENDEIITIVERFATGVARIWDRILMARLVKAQQTYVHKALSSTEWIMTSFDTAVDLVQLAGRAGSIATVTESSTVPHSTLENQMTVREREVMSLVSIGKNDKDIAQELAIAPSTVKSHIRNTMRKFGAVNRADLISRYYAFPPR
jgi:DNA-binding CsgD family transcriptional regulator